MKIKYSVAATVLLMGALVGCTEGEKAQKTFTPIEKIEQKVIAKSNTSELKVVGDKLDSEYLGTGELKKIAHVNADIDYKPIQMKIKDVKIIYIDELGQGAKDSLSAVAQMFGQKVSEKDKKKKVSYPVIEVEYEIENTTDKNVNFGFLQAIVLNTGEQIEPVISLNEPGNSDLSSDFFGKVKFEGKVTYPIKSKPEDIKSAKLIFSAVVNNDTMNTLNEGKTLTVNFQ